MFACTHQRTQARSIALHIQIALTCKVGPRTYRRYLIHQLPQNLLMWLWAVPEIEGTQERRSVAGRADFRLPTLLPDFVLQRCRAAGLDDAAVQQLVKGANHRDEHITMHGLLQVELGPHFTDCLDASWSMESQFLQSFFADAADAFCIRVVAVWVIPDWEDRPKAQSLVRKRHRWNRMRGGSFDVATASKSGHKICNVLEVGWTHIFPTRRLCTRAGGKTKSIQQPRRWSVRTKIFQEYHFYESLSLFGSCCSEATGLTLFLWHDGPWKVVFFLPRLACQTIGCRRCRGSI